ncbi:MAG: NTP transferase domain-containing protein, partial [Chloroflexi bacterium]|nr:NTP transferase domain-containing protein [Chloroflexota bacterium]
MATKLSKGRPVVGIIQARMSSSRLPGKALLAIAGVPMLKRVVDRVRRASLVDKVVVATTSDASDDAIEEACKSWQVDC